MKEKIIVYPYDEQFSPVLRHKQLLEDYEIAGLVSPMGWGFTGKDAGQADKGSVMGINVSSDFEGRLDQCDAVLFCESRISLDFEKYILKNVIKAVERRKNIIFTMPLTNDAFNTIQNRCDEHGVSFKYYNYKSEKVEYQEKGADCHTIHDIDTPVIFVLGNGDRTNKFEIQLALRENIQKMGYKISQVGTREYCELFGFHSFPLFMYSTISEVNKVVLFNRFIKKIEKEETPDVIIIGIPGGIMLFNNNLPNGFGILAYEVCQAVTPDASVFSCHYEDYEKDFFTRMTDTAKKRLGCKVDCFSISNSLVDWQHSNYEKKMIYTSLDTGFVDEKIKKFKKLNIPVFNVLNSGDAGQMADYLINKLSEYGETSCI